MWEALAPDTSSPNREKPSLRGAGRAGKERELQLPSRTQNSDGAVKTHMGTKRDFPSTQGISTQSRGAVPTRMSLLGIVNQKDPKHISNLQTSLICTMCQPGLGSSRGQTPWSCTLLHPTAGKSENSFAGTIHFLLLLLLFLVCWVFFFHFILRLFHFFSF